MERGRLDDDVYLPLFSTSLQDAGCPHKATYLCG